MLYIVAGRGLRKGLNEVIKVLEDTDDTAGGTTGVSWNRIKEGIDVTISKMKKISLLDVVLGLVQTSNFR